MSEHQPAGADERPDAELTEAERNERAFTFLSMALQARIYAVLNGAPPPDAPAPADGWAAVPTVCAHAVGMVLGNILRASLLKPACDEQYALYIVESVRGIVERAVLEALPEPAPGARWH